MRVFLLYLLLNISFSTDTKPIHGIGIMIFFLGGGAWKRVASKESYDIMIYTNATDTYDAHASLYVTCTCGNC